MLSSFSMLRSRVAALVVSLVLTAVAGAAAEPSRLTAEGTRTDGARVPGEGSRAGDDPRVPGEGTCAGEAARVPGDGGRAGDPVRVPGEGGRHGEESRVPGHAVRATEAPRTAVET